MFEKLVPYDAAYIILDAYIQYYHLFKRITKRAKIRFEHRDWLGIQADARSRNSLYRDSVGETTQKLLGFLGDQAADPEVWRHIKEHFQEEILNFNTRNIAETYFNSIYRHSHRGRKVDAELMFVKATGTYREFRSALPIYYTFYVAMPLEVTIYQLLTCYQFDTPYEDQKRDIKFIVRTIEKELLKDVKTYSTSRIEVLKSVFYRNKAAYLVGRIYLDDRIHPFVLPLFNGKNGIVVDTVLLEMNDVSSIFSYNRSYFLVDTDIASDMVDFLKTILPTKSLGELYNSIGFEKHGKTVLYRNYLRHMDTTLDKFTIAPGVRGMVMIVFTLPSYNMVFKVIKDKFAAPKQVTVQEVKDKYEIVSQHDRVGRMADSHMFQNFIFEKDRFSKALLEELKQEIPSKLKITDKTVEIEHLYIEKKMIPLDIYLEDATLEEAEVVIDEYGKAIKDMAAVNIFPGDMLLKNFGVTRLKRVVFYDYDEIGYLTDYNFRVIPPPRDFADEWASEPWYSVGPFDVFPEEFSKFLIGRKEIKALFQKYHADLFEPKYWRQVQNGLKAGKLYTVYPYREMLRFKQRY
ncbi:MAG TPA: bifunctional isocitrate dehydrogenase kinase/phosphatase [Saprospiraceae bacterium]|nr:bifunctional isocitrate dehydrogenase kinase/phosphatase [Saprospiraceae bacterium]